LRKILIQAATGAVKKKNSYYKAKYNRLIFKLGSKNKAKVAIANRMARAIYHIIKDKVRFKDIGAVRADTTDHQIRRAINKLKSLGVDVQFHYHQKIVEATKPVTVAA